jgi:hypothetical protein
VCLLLQSPNPLFGQPNTSPDSQGRPQKSEHKETIQKTKKPGKVCVDFFFVFLYFHTPWFILLMISGGLTQRMQKYCEW